VLSDIEQYADYSKNCFKKPDSDTINYLHDNYDRMNLNDKMMMFRKLVSESQINAILLRIEMKNYEPTEKVDNLGDFMKLANKILTRYQHKAGGFKFEDNLWLIDNDNYDIILRNSLPEVSCDNETMEYVDMLVSMLNKLSDNISVKSRLNHARKDRILWVELIIEDENYASEKEENEIAL
jgi:hypothetical protein